ncbi:MAG: peroxiredoxin family protein [Candidatus Methylomirabilales bacterium]
MDVQALASIPAQGQMLPDVTLVAADGSAVPLSRYRHNRNLVLAFLGPRAALLQSPLVPSLKREYGAIQEAEAEVLVVLNGPPEDAAAAGTALQLPFPLLSDPDGDAHKRFGARGDGPAIYVADRFGEIHFAAHPTTPGELPSALDLLGWLNYIELLCPE